MSRRGFGADPGSAGAAHRWALAALFLFALASRLADLDWDDGHAFHPDERAVAFAVERLSFRPLNLNPEFFAYGSLPFYLTRAAASLVARSTRSGTLDFAGLVLVGRTLSALAGALTVLALFRLGSALHGRASGLLAAFLLSACVLHIQHSHFMTGDVLLTLLCLLTLAACVRLVRHASIRDAAFAGAGAGLAMATKVSAAPLLAPVAAALVVLFARERSPRKLLVRSALAVASLVAAFALGEPYAFIDPAAFLRQVAEQGAMVRHAGSLPYTIQYVGAFKYAYDLGQMVLWGMGPLLGVAVLWAAARRVWGFVGERSAETAVLLSWVVPYVLITGWFEVKFIRYLLPVYPVLILWAAAWLSDGRRSRFGAWRLRLVAGGTLLAAVAFLAVYRGPHTVVAASEWVYRSVPAGRAILTPHWDEGFPLPLPGGQPDQYRVLSFPFYDPDTPEKLDSLARELERTDYVAFPTKRIYGAITAVPERYPLTDRFLRRLFAGDLGFRLAHTATARPRLLGLEALDELADESFTVYDHPKVVVFAKQQALSIEELRSRLEADTSVLPSRRDLLLAGTAGNAWLGLAWAREPVRASLLGLLWFVAALELLGLAAWGLLRRSLPPLGGEAAAKVVGLLAFAFGAWLLAYLWPGSFDGPFLTALFGLSVLLGWLQWRREPGGGWGALRWETEALFWGSFAFFLAVRAWNPAIYWGEKPMDFAFLNVLSRATSLPAPEPWFAGAPLQYTYFGHFLVAALGKLCSLHPGLTYNLGIALVGGLSTTAAFALGCAIGERRRIGLLAAAAIVLVGNLNGPLELLRRRTLDFDYFWATSRVIRDSINEYPLWSLLFADLHAHVLAIPLSLTFLALAVWWARGRFSGPPAAGLGLLGLVLGSVLVTNAWSAPTYLLFFPFLLACFALADPALRAAGVRGALLGLGRKVAAPSLIVVALAFGLYLPFWLGYRPPQLGWGWERDAFVSARGYVLIFGFPLFVGISFLVAQAARTRPPRLAWTALGASGLALGAALPGAAPLLSVRTALIVAGLLATWLALRSEATSDDRTVSALLAFAFFVTAGCDVVHVWDRMNTLFKFYLDAWLLLSAAAAAALPWLWSTLPPGWGRAAWRGTACALAATAVFTGLTSTLAAVRTERVPTPRPTLDGTAYLARRDPLEAAALEWLNANVSGTPVVAEAWGQSYGDFARVSMNTGLPDVLGWEYHVYQRGHSWPEIEERKQDLARLYGSQQKRSVRRVLEKYGVAYVYVGGLERQAYGDAALERLARFADLLEPLYANAGVTVFGVRSREGGPRLGPPSAKPAIATRELVVTELQDRVSRIPLGRAARKP